MFTRKTHVKHERGVTYENRTYEFNLDNDFRCNVPVKVWLELENEWFDRNFSLKYRDAFIPL